MNYAYELLFEPVLFLRVFNVKRSNIIRPCLKRVKVPLSLASFLSEKRMRVKFLREKVKLS